jgi:hypothetical protein
MSRPDCVDLDQPSSAHECPYRSKKSKDSPDYGSSLSEQNHANIFISVTGTTYFTRLGRQLSDRLLLAKTRRSSIAAFDPKQKFDLGPAGAPRMTFK